MQRIVTDTYILHRYWWLLGIRGLVAVLFGLAAILWPGLTLFILILLFSAYALVDGVMAVVVSLQERKHAQLWWVLLLEGIASIIIGVLAFLWPAITALVLLYLIASWAIVTGILEIAAAFAGWPIGVQRWALALAGAVSILLGVLLAIQPGAGLLSLVWLIGVYALIFGVLFIVRAFQFRQHPVQPGLVENV